MMVQPSLTTFIAQASIGYIVANFALILARILLVPNERNYWFVFWLAAVFVVGLGIGIAAGLIIWVCAVMLRRSPNAIYRTVIGMVMVATLWFVLAVSLGWQPATPVEQLWVLAVIIVPGISIGLVTNSRLRLWHELVRQGEALRRLPRILAGFTGFVLRPLVVFFFMSCLIVLIARLQTPDSEVSDWVWPGLLCGHFGVAVCVLFARLKTSRLFPLAVIVNAPIVAALIQFRLSRPDIPYLAIPYLGVWAVFLLTRWRQSDVGLAFLNEEIHYYLID